MLRKGLTVSPSSIFDKVQRTSTCLHTNLYFIRSFTRGIQRSTSLHQRNLRQFKYSIYWMNKNYKPQVGFLNLFYHIEWINPLQKCLNELESVLANALDKGIITNNQHDFLLLEHLTVLFNQLIKRRYDWVLQRHFELFTERRTGKAWLDLFLKRCYPGQASSSEAARGSLDHGSHNAHKFAAVALRQ